MTTTFVPVRDSPAGALLDRLVSLLLIASAILVVVWLAGVQPDPRGHGTHTQLGLRPCGWAVAYGKPCPTCGVTTAAAHLVHLAPLRAFLVQPFGFALAVAGLGLAAMAAFCLLKRRSLLEWLTRLPHGRILSWGLILFFASWFYKYLTFVP